MIESELMIPAPLSVDGKHRLGAYAAIRLTGVAIDSSDRIVVTGDAVTRLGSTCSRDKPFAGPISIGLIARFEPDGRLDSEFAHDGVAGGHKFSELPLGAQVIAEPMVSSNGAITYRSTSAYRCARRKSKVGLGQLTTHGQPRVSFGTKGGLVGQFSAISTGPAGSFVAISNRPGLRGKTFEAFVTRFDARGEKDASFGHGGHAAIRLGNVDGVFNSLALDKHGRILAEGTFGIERRRSMVLVRLSASGTQESSFGPHGRISIPFPYLGEPSVLGLDQQGRAVTVHPYEEPGGAGGLVAARYILH